MFLFLRFPRVRPRRSLGSSLAVVSLLATLLAVSFSPVSAQNNPTTVPGPNTVTADRIGPASASLQLKLAFPLKVTNQGDLDQTLADMYDPTSPNYKQFLTPQEFTRRYTNQVDRTAIDTYLKGQGFTLTDSGLGILVTATATVAQAEKTFGVTISNYQDKTTGKIFYQNDAPVSIPQALSSKITDIIGLSNDHHFYPRTKQVPQVSTDNAQPKNNGTPAGCAGAVTAANSASPGSFTPNQLKTAYNFDPFYTQNVTGVGQTVAVYELDDYVDNNVATYQSCFNTSVPLERVPVDGGVSSIGGGQVEVELDIEVIAGMAPGLSKILVYEADGSGSSYLDEFQKMANDDRAQVVSISWGDCEGDSTVTHSFLDTENTIFAQMALNGQSVFSASGDYGAQGCLPINGDTGLWASDILDTQYVTGVGGTRLNLNSNNTISSEVTWNDYSTGYGASAGGVSDYFTRPSWQIGDGTNGKYSNGFRMTPDVSAAASPYTAYVVYSAGGNGSPVWEPIGGTSASSPLWASAAALTNDYLINKLGQPKLGFANPTIYRIFNSSGSLMTYHDITVGDNCYDPSCGTPNSGTAIFPATRGYDMATGIGSLNAFNFARNSCITNVTSNLNSGTGTLRTLAGAAALSNADCKVIGLDSTHAGSSTINLSTSLTISGNVTVIGPNCGVNGPTFNIVGPGTTGTSLTLTGASLSGVKVSGFGGPQLKAQAGPDYLKCVKVSQS